MNPEKPKSHVESEWKTETEEHRDAVSRFLQEYLTTPLEQRKTYDSLSGLHFSGANSRVMPKIAEGTAAIVKVDVFYESGKPNQVHVVFDSEGAGHNIEVYLKARALSDYLGEEKQ